MAAAPSDEALGESGAGLSLLDLHILLATESIPGVEIADTVIINGGTCDGLLQYDRSERVIKWDQQWPHVDAAHQSRGGLFTTKRSTEVVARADMIAAHFSTAPLTAQPYSAVGAAAKAVDPRPCAMVLRDVSGEGRVPRQSAANAALEIEVAYMTAERISTVVQDLATTEATGLLMKYTAPPRNFHNMVRAIFTPYVTKIEMHECTVALDDVRVPLASRTSTGRKANIRTVKVEPPLEKAVGSACGALYEFFKSRDVALHQAVMYFIEIGVGRVQLLWCSHLSLRPWQGPKDAPVQPSGSNTPRALAAPSTPPTTPVSHQQATEQYIDMVDQIKDFGFYPSDAEKIKNALKRQIVSISRVTSLPASMEVDDTPPYDEKFIQALCDPVRGEAYFRRLNALSSRGAAGSQQLGLQRMGTLTALRRSFLLSPSLKEAVDELDRNLRLAATPTKDGSSSPTAAAMRRRQSVVTIASLGSPTSQANLHRQLMMGSFSQTLPPSATSPKHTPGVDSGVADTPLSRHASVADAHGRSNSVNPLSSSIIFAEASLERSVSTRHMMATESVASSVGASDEDTAHDPIARLVAAAPDPYHSGHIAKLRRKYRNDDLRDDTAEARFKADVIRELARKKAIAAMAARAEQARLRHHKKESTVTSISVTQHNGTTSHVHNTTTKRRPSSAAAPSLVLRESSVAGDKWVDVTHIDHSRTTPFKRLAKRIHAPRSDSATGRPISGYAAKLRDATLSGYVVSNDPIEREVSLPPSEQPLFLTDDDIRKAARYKPEKQRVPDAPVVEVANTHLSLSEEMVLAQKRRGFQSRDVLEMLFHEGGGEAKQHQRVGDAVDDELIHHFDLSQSGGVLLMHSHSQRRTQGGTATSMRLDDSATPSQLHDLIDGNSSAMNESARVQRLQLQQALQEEQQYETMMSAKFGALETKEAIASLINAFEDLMYQFKSEEKKSKGPRQPEIVLRIPQHYASLQPELRSLMLGIGFKERSFVPPPLPLPPASDAADGDDGSASSPRGTSPSSTLRGRSQSFVAKSLADLMTNTNVDDDLFGGGGDDGNTSPMAGGNRALPFKEYVITNNAVTISMVHARADQYACDVATMFANGEWNLLQKIRHLVDSEGYTFFDAVVGVKKNLLKRATVARKRSAHRFERSSAASSPRGGLDSMSASFSRKGSVSFASESGAGSPTL